MAERIVQAVRKCEFKSKQNNLKTEKAISGKERKSKSWKVKLNNDMSQAERESVQTLVMHDK